MTDSDPRSTLGNRTPSRDVVRSVPRVERPRITRDARGIPTYESSYLSHREQQGRLLLKMLADPVTSRSMSLDAVWKARPAFPIAACFNVHTICNEACIMCPYDGHYAQNEHGVMPIAEFRKLVDEFVSIGGRIVTFNNFSDIFAHNRGIDYIEAVLDAHRDVEVYLVTNGLAMKPKYVDRLAARGFDGIVYVSCHGYTEDTFRAVTQRSGLSKVLQHVEYLVRVHPHPSRVIVQYATDFSTKAEVKAAKKFWNRLGVTLNTFRTHTFAGNSAHRDEPPRAGRLAGCTGWGQDAGQPFYQVVVQSNGDVSLCCHDLTSSVVLGNAFRDGIEAVWNSQAFKSLVADLYLDESTDSSFICRRCSLAQVCER